MGNWGAPSISIATALDRGRNSLNAIRLVLALLVIVSHSWAIGGFGPEPELGGAHLGTWSVLGFFAISGYLITASRVGSSTGRFYKARALRILPGFLVCIIFIAGVFAPLSTLSGGTWSASSAVSYVARNVALYPPHFAQDGITDTLGGVPYQRMWDGSLWTLFWEACCYVLIGVLVSMLPRKALLPAVALLAALTLMLSAADGLGVVSLPGIGDRVVPLVATFLAGALLFLAAERTPLNRTTVIVAVAWLAAVTALGLTQQLGGVPIAFLLIALGTRAEAAPVGRKYDASYGFYIYAWPVQQLLVLLLGGFGGVWLLAAFSVAVTAPLAYLSCWLIERPALRLVGPRRSAVPAVAPVP